ncbi:uncharacterized protein SCHCODRAFT_01087923, partial [Schizophyllum commune H4-8]|uniref:uncharacterized protein n=1 Tax=Schizophyllum commune (strain H4-8 / FGSC 9210) TaxID=578458 RepID=UPI002160A1B8
TDSAYINTTAVRVEWAKARARSERWREEVMLLEEEMQRVLRHLAWTGQEWAQRADALPTRDAYMCHGLRAYALRQRAIVEAVARSFRERWMPRIPHLLSRLDEGCRLPPLAPPPSKHVPRGPSSAPVHPHD